MAGLESENQSFHQQMIHTAALKINSNFAGAASHQQPADDCDRNQNDAIFHR